MILIDCPPSLGVLTVGALSAAQQVLIPLQAETLSHRGVGQLLDTIYDVKQSINSSLTILGVLPTMYDGRTRHAQNVLAAISETYDLPVIEPAIPKSIRFAEAPAIGRTVLSTASRHKGAEAYREVAKVLIAAKSEEEGHPKKASQHVDCRSCTSPPTEPVDPARPGAWELLAGVTRGRAATAAAAVAVAPRVHRRDRWRPPPRPPSLEQVSLETVPAPVTKIERPSPPTSSR